MEHEIPESSIGFMLSKLGFHTAAGFTAILEPLGIGPPHFAVLRFIGTFEASSQQALAEALGIPPSRVVAFVDVLEQLELVERRRNPSDRRAHALFLTKNGRRLLDEAQERATRFEEELCAGLSKDERTTLLKLLHRVAATRDIPIDVHPGLRTDAPVTPPRA